MEWKWKKKNHDTSIDFLPCVFTQNCDGRRIWKTKYGLVFIKLLFFVAIWGIVLKVWDCDGMCELVKTESGVDEEGLITFIKVSTKISGLKGL